MTIPVRENADIQMAFTCFSCQEPMDHRGSWGWCLPCGVREYRDPLYIPRTRTVTWQLWNGQRLDYVDHSSGYHPTP